MLDRYICVLYIRLYLPSSFPPALIMATMKTSLRVRTDSGKWIYIRDTMAETEDDDEHRLLGRCGNQDWSLSNWRSQCQQNALG